MGELKHRIILLMPCLIYTTLSIIGADEVENSKKKNNETKILVDNYVINETYQMENHSTYILLNKNNTIEKEGMTNVIFRETDNATLSLNYKANENGTSVNFTLTRGDISNSGCSFGCEIDLTGQPSIRRNMFILYIMKRSTDLLKLRPYFKKYIEHAIGIK